MGQLKVHGSEVGDTGGGFKIVSAESDENHPVS